MTERLIRPGNYPADELPLPGVPGEAKRVVVAWLNGRGEATEDRDAVEDIRATYLDDDARPVFFAYLDPDADAE